MKKLKKIVKEVKSLGQKTLNTNDNLYSEVKN
jgi:hypothetical protein